MPVSRDRNKVLGNLDLKLPCPLTFEAERSPSSLVHHVQGSKYIHKL
jgi:hypothetical protein